MWTYSFILINLTLAVWYFLLFRKYRKGWESVAINNTPPLTSGEEVTVIIPFRNEEENLPGLIDSLESQNYQRLKFIFIDDHSNDKSLGIVKAFCSRNPAATVYELLGPVNGKKQALELALSNVHTNWVLCTDADTLRGPNWVGSMIGQAVKDQSVFVSGPVELINQGDLFSNWQSLEFAGLIGIGAAGIFRGKPALCNGANILYKTSAFRAAGGYRNNDGIASGDDQFLMHQIADLFPGKVSFCKDREAIVLSYPKESVRDFIQQRIRWASKTGKYKKISVSLEMVGIWLFNASLLLGFLSTPNFPLIGLSIYLAFYLKQRAERQFYQTILPFFNGNNSMSFFWLSSLIQSLYVFTIGLLSKFVPHSWKERTH